MCRRKGTDMIGFMRYAAVVAATRMRSERGATMVEYALMVAAVAMVAIGAAFLLGGGVAGLFDKSTTQLNK
jgi:pilus assembly protein Flp/PilA